MQVIIQTVINFVLNIFKFIPKNSLEKQNHYNDPEIEKTKTKKLDKEVLEKTIDAEKKKAIQQPEPPKFFFPVHNRRITSRFGWRRLPDGKGGTKRNWHSGLDYTGKQPEGKKIAYATEDCVVKKVLAPHPREPYRFKYNWRKKIWEEVNPKAYTPYVVVQGIHTGNRYVHKHGNPLVKEGDVVKAGQPISTIAGFGWSFGDHLHLEVLVKKSNGKYKTIDPEKYFKKVRALTLDKA